MPSPARRPAAARASPPLLHHAGRTKSTGDMKKKAVLLSGPPGIGKTTAALCLCRELGLTPVEVNASDSRGKADASVLKGVGGKLANSIKELSTNAAVSFSAGGRRDKVGRCLDVVLRVCCGQRRGRASRLGAEGLGIWQAHTAPHNPIPNTQLCLIMDEVDGMSAGDRGGVADLIQVWRRCRAPTARRAPGSSRPPAKPLAPTITGPSPQTIHKTRTPIIAICNDKYNQKLRSLRNHCLELEFRK